MLLTKVNFSQSSFESSPAILVHGPRSTGKSTLLREFLSRSTTTHSIVSCRQCATARILLQRIIRSVKQDISEPSKNHSESLDVAEHFTGFCSSINSYFKENDYAHKTHVLVLDNFDELDDPHQSDLYSCFARLSEISEIQNLVVIFVINSLEPRPLITTSIPHIFFPGYTKDELISIMARKPLRRLSPEYLTMKDPKKSIEDYQNGFWRQYCSLVVDSLSDYTGADLRLVSQAALKLWPKFVKPITNGSLQSTDFVRLYRESSGLFSSEFAVIDSLVDSEEAPEFIYELPAHSKFILCAAYLASYNPPNYDIRFFSKMKEVRAKRRDTSRRKKLKIDPRSLEAPSFDLERMLAILHSISSDWKSGSIVTNVDVGVQIATLTALKLILRTSSNDPLDSRTRWKINTNWSIIQQMANDINLPITDYLME